MVSPPSSVVYGLSYVLRGEDHPGVAHFSDTRRGGGGWGVAPHEG